MRLAHTVTNGISGILLNGRLRAYLDILVVGSGARVFGLASQFVVLIILSRILSKDSFGDLMTAFGFYRLAAWRSASAARWSCCSMSRASATTKRGDQAAPLFRPAGRRPSARLRWRGLCCAGPIAAALGKPALAIWLQQLAPFAIFSTLLVIRPARSKAARESPNRSFSGEVAPNAVRIVLLPIVWRGSSCRMPTSPTC